MFYNGNIDITYTKLKEKTVRAKYGQILIVFLVLTSTVLILHGIIFKNLDTGLFGYLLLIISSIYHIAQNNILTRNKDEKPQFFTFSKLFTVLLILVSTVLVLHGIIFKRLYTGLSGYFLLLFSAVYSALQNRLLLRSWNKKSITDMPLTPADLSDSILHGHEIQNSKADHINATTHSNYGKQLPEILRMQENESPYKLALESDPNNATTHSNYGNLLIEDLSFYLQLLRPELYYIDLALPASSAILASYIATGGLPGHIPFLIAIIGGFAAITSSYVFHDYCDVVIDTTNVPYRPLPSSRVSRISTLLYALLLLLIAGAAAAYLNPESLLILIIATGTITIYSIFAKRSIFLSFLPVGIFYGLVSIGIWLAFDPAGLLKGGDGVILPLPAICFGLMMCVTDWAFTLGGVARDVEGDRLEGAPTMPATFGIPFTARFITFWWIVGVIASVVLGWYAHLGPVYFAGALASGLWMLVKCFGFIKHPTPERGGALFLNGSNYRVIMFGSMILDVVLCIYAGAYTSILW